MQLAKPVNMQNFQNKEVGKMRVISKAHLKPPTTRFHVEEFNYWVLRFHMFPGTLTAKLAISLDKVIPSSSLVLDETKWDSDEVIRFVLLYTTDSVILVSLYSVLFRPMNFYLNTVVVEV